MVCPEMVYPEIAKLMACKKMSQRALSEILHISQQATAKKLVGKTDWKRREMVAIKEHFKDIAPEITMEQLFDVFLPR